MPDSPVKKVNIMDGGWGGNSFFRWSSWGVAISFLLLNKTIYSLFRACVQIRGHPLGAGTFKWRIDRQEGTIYGRIWKKQFLGRRIANVEALSRWSLASLRSSSTRVVGENSRRWGWEGDGWPTCILMSRQEASCTKPDHNLTWFRTRIFIKVQIHWCQALCYTM